MKFTIFNFLELVSFTTPLGVALAVGAKSGVAGVVVGLTLGLIAGFGMFRGMVSAIDRFAGWIGPAPEGRAAELTILAFLLGGFGSVFAASFATCFVMERAIHYLGLP
jgi:hypothetical protein